MREDDISSIGQAISFYDCLACNRKIYLDKRFVDRKGRMIALEPYGLQQHRCLWERTQGMQTLGSGRQANVQNDHFHQGRRQH